MRTIYGLALILLTVVCCGCGPENRAEISGKVLLDGQPLKKGSISFIPTAGNKGPAAGASISDGTYHIKREKGAAIGKNIVQIRALKATGKKMRSASGELFDEFVSVVPSEYGANSKIVKEVRPGANQIDINIETSPKK
ncbi:MAG: hypothetical protein JXM70_07815 [Pirellulales bacterium]|nr:hypothetical protein [Pirellulales bacterium]